METYITKLITNLPNEKIGKINLILDGGAFSGSYILGSLYYIKELEKLKKIKVNKMSGCSIGSILCILYKLDDLDYCTHVYSKIRKYFKQNGNLYIIYEVMNELIDKMDENFYKICNKKIFLTYYDIKYCKSVVKCNFNSNKEIIDTMVKSSYIPYICGTNILYKERYLDGLNPYIFNRGKTIFINLCMDYKCITGMLNIKNEINNVERILYGILDIHTFFLTQKPTAMCYYIDNMTNYQKLLHTVRLIIINIITHLSYISYYIFQHFKTSNNYLKYNYVFSNITHYVKKSIFNYIKYFMV